MRWYGTSAEEERLFNSKAHYLRYVIEPGYTDMANHTAETIRTLQVPTVVTDLTSFRWQCTVFRRLLVIFA